MRVRMGRVRRAVCPGAIVVLLAAIAACSTRGDRALVDTTGAAAAAAPAPAGSTATALGAGPPTAAQTSGSPANAGYDEPENLVYDSQNDVYLVSNIDGGPVARDANGFISRVAPDGRVVALKWIDGSNPATRLDAPKGLAIHGDTLAVADVGAVRLFDRRTGKSLGVWPIPHSQLLNDVAFAPDGTLYVTDTGPKAGQPDTADDMAVYHFATPSRATPIARDTTLAGPDGLVVSDSDLVYATFYANRLVHIGLSGVGQSEGTRRVLDTLPGDKVDGLRRLPDNSLVVTSWGARAVYRIMPDGTRHVELTDVTSPAGVAYDAGRNQLAITSMQDNRLYLVPLR